MKRFLSLALACCFCISLCACGKSAEAKKVDELILAIGNVSLESKEAVRAAQESYDALSEEEKKEVENYSVLQDAQALIERVASVEEKIDAIGTVNAESEPLITAAKEAFDSLPEEEQRLVSNRDTLADAVNEYTEISASCWEIEYMVDEFGDETDDALLKGKSAGKFSNTATTGSELSVIAFYTKISGDPVFAFRLIEYGNHIATYMESELKNLSFKIGDTVYDVECWGTAPNGDIYFTQRYNRENASLRSFNGTNRKEAFNQFLEALRQGETISCSLVIGSYDNIICGVGGSRYTFKVEGKGFAEKEKEIFG